MNLDWGVSMDNWSRLGGDSIQFLWVVSSITGLHCLSDRRNELVSWESLASLHFRRQHAESSDTTLVQTRPISPSCLGFIISVISVRQFFFLFPPFARFSENFPWFGAGWQAFFTNSTFTLCALTFFWNSSWIFTAANLNSPMDSSEERLSTTRFAVTSLRMTLSRRRDSCCPVMISFEERRWLSIYTLALFHGKGSFVVGANIWFHHYDGQGCPSFCRLIPFLIL